MKNIMTSIDLQIETSSTQESSCRRETWPQNFLKIYNISDLIIPIYIIKTKEMIDKFLLPAYFRIENSKCIKLIVLFGLKVIHLAILTPLESQMISWSLSLAQNQDLYLCALYSCLNNLDKVQFNQLKKNFIILLLVYVKSF